MILTEVKANKTVVSKKIKKSKIYINTLMPNFKFKDKLGKIVKPINRCITM
jgi:hypothetical protein